MRWVVRKGEGKEREADGEGKKDGRHQGDSYCAVICSFHKNTPVAFRYRTLSLAMRAWPFSPQSL